MVRELLAPEDQPPALPRRAEGGLPVSQFRDKAGLVCEFVIALPARGWVWPRGQALSQDLARGGFERAERQRWKGSIGLSFRHHGCTAFVCTAKA
jgi:hypothetical protein